MFRTARNRKSNNHGKKDIPKIAITAKITKIINQASDPGKYDESLKENSRITNQVNNSGK